MPLLSKIIETDVRLEGRNRTWNIDAFHAENDDMVGTKGRQWFDSCWLPGATSATSERRDSLDSVQHYSYKSYDYRSEIVKGTDHNYLMDPAFGASELWLQRVRAAFPRPLEVRQPMPNGTLLNADELSMTRLYSNSMERRPRRNLSTTGGDVHCMAFWER